MLLYLRFMTNRTNPDLLRTAKLPACTMADLVYGPRPRRVRFPLRLIFVVAFCATIGCASQAKPVATEVESVGTLSASYASIATAPVHATTDFATPQVVDSDEDAPVTVAAPAAVEAPNAVAKVAHGF